MKINAGSRLEILVHLISAILSPVTSAMTPPQAVKSAIMGSVIYGMINVDTANSAR